MKNFKLLCAILVAVTLLASVSVFAAEAEFSDVPEGKWYYNVVTEACEKGLMEGKGEGKFAPEENLSRAQYITILWRISGDEADSEHSFTDIPSGAWYEKYVGWAVKLGIISGYSDNTFRGNNPVSRQELMVMTVRYLDSVWLDLTESEGYEERDLSALSDAGDIASWASYQVQKMYSSGLIEGKSGGRICPKDKAKRAEIAAVMVRLVDKIAPLQSGYSIGGTSLSEFSVDGDGLSETTLAEVLGQLKASTGVELKAGNAAHSIKFKVDETLPRLQYKAAVVDGSLEFYVSNEYAVSYFPQIVGNALGGLDGFAVGSGFEAYGSFTLDNAREQDYDSLHYLCETNKNPLAYDLGEEVTFRVSLLSGDRLVAVPQFSYEYATDEGKTVTGIEPGISGQLILSFDGMATAGTGRLTVTPANKKGLAIADMIEMVGSVIFDFESITSLVAAPDDFEAFWEAKMTELDAVPLEAIKFEICPVYSREGYDVYCAVVPTQADPAHLHISVPKNAQPGSLKIFGCFDGYGEPTSDGADYHSDGITVSVNSHSISNHATAEEYAAYNEAINGWAFENPEYLIDMLCRDVQGMKFAVAQFADLWNGCDMITSGGSMGGFQAIGVAALYDKVSECRPSVAWMCDIAGEDMGTRLGGWRPYYNDVSKYVDSTYFAALFDGVVRMEGGLGDYICPPTGIAALYNAFASADKSVSFMQSRDHGYIVGAYNSIYTVSSLGLSSGDEYIDLTDTGCAVEAPNYISDSDASRELNASEEAMKAAADAMKSGEKRLTGSYVDSGSLIASEFEETLYSLLTEKYGLDPSCTVEIDPDDFAAFLSAFRETEAGQVFMEPLEYTIYDTAGGYYNAKISTFFTKG